MKNTRLLSIVMMIIEKKKVSAQYLAETFGVSRRTIYRDLEVINNSGIPIYSTPGVGGGFEIMENFKIDKTVFTKEDLTVMLSALSTYPNIVNTNEITAILAKIRNFIPEDNVKEIDTRSNHIYIDLTTWTGNKNVQHNLESIKIALNTNSMLSFDYISIHGFRTKRSIEPYQLLFKSNHWYIHGYCLEKEDFRLFKLSRISMLEINDASFIPRKHSAIQLETGNYLEKMQIDIKIKIHKSILDRILDHCTIEQFKQIDEEYFLVDFPFIENDYYYDLLLSFGNKCECLEPENVREQLISKIHELSLIYT